MAESFHPPYVPGSLAQFRTLNRWLDINAQNGPLERTQTYIILPAFNVNSFWPGFDDLVLAFNFECPNNFSFTKVTDDNGNTISIVFDSTIAGGVWGTETGDIIGTETGDEIS